MIGYLFERSTYSRRRLIKKEAISMGGSIDSFLFIGSILWLVFLISNNPSLSPQRCLYFKDFQGLKLLESRLEVGPNKHILTEFQWFYSIRHWYAVYR